MILLNNSTRTMRIVGHIQILQDVSNASYEIDEEVGL